MKEENSAGQDADFLKEKIKQRPLNKKKLLRRTLITATMAVLFGTIACVTFLLLEPVINNWLYPAEEPELIEFPEEDLEDEILPEDMIADEIQMQAEKQAENPPPEVAVVDDAHIRDIAAAILAEKKAGTEDYLSMNSAILEVAREAGKAIVTVTGVTPEVDWFNNAFENRGQTAGIVVWDNGQEYHILAKLEAIKDAESIMVTFADGRQYPANIQKKNTVTGLVVLAVAKGGLDSATMAEIKVAKLGDSALSIVGTPIIAIGNVLADTKSICYGFVTSAGGSINLTDASYKLITTDIYGSSNAAGVIINMQGHVIGIIDSSYNSTEVRNIVSAIGITELKQLIRTMSNDGEKAYAGILGTDVTPEANATLGVPLGTYVTEVKMDSPAMEAGIQSGDVIIKVGENEIAGYSDYVRQLFQVLPEDTVAVTVMRQGAEGYFEVALELVLGHSE